MSAVLAFSLLVVGGGAGAFGGSVIGGAFGHYALFAGGIIGGIAGSSAAAFLAARLSWIDRADRKGAAVGAALGFVAAAGIAVNTLHSPVGPVLSTLLVGIGGLAGARLQASTRAKDIEC